MRGTTCIEDNALHSLTPCVGHTVGSTPQRRFFPQLGGDNRTRPSGACTNRPFSWMLFRTELPVNALLL